MIDALVIAAALIVPHRPSTAPRAAPTRVSLSAWPSRVAIQAGGSRVVRIRSAGRGSLRVDARVAGYALDPHGSPRIAGAPAATYVTVRPRRMTVGRAGTPLVVSTHRPRRAQPGDHSALILLTALAPSANGVLVHVRIGLVVSVRVPGTLVHRIDVRAVRLKRVGRRRLIELTLLNKGNVIEVIDSARLQLTLMRRGRVIARLRPEPRKLLPRASGLVDLRYSGPVHGRVTARVEIRHTGRPPRPRDFPLRL